MSTSSLAGVWRHRLAHCGLFPRQQEALDLAAAGAGNAAIAAALSVREGTVKQYFTGILRQLDARCRGEAVLLVLGLSPTSALWLARLRRQPLTPQQRVVLTLTAFGASLYEIAEQLGCAPGTVRKHRDAIYRRLGARSRAHAVGIVLGLAEPCERSDAA